MLRIVLLAITIGYITCHETGKPHEHKKTTKPLPKKDVCLTKHCIAASHRIFQYMDENVNPCDNFYDFACGGFTKNQIIPEDLTRWTIFNTIGKKIDYQGRKLLESPINEEEDFESDQKAKIFYKSCMQLEKIDELGSEPIKKLLAKVGGWPVVEGDKWNAKNYSIWDQNVKMLHLGYSSDYIFEVSIDADSKNNSHRVLQLDQTSLGLNQEYWAKGMEEPEVKAYFK